MNTILYNIVLLVVRKQIKHISIVYKMNMVINSFANMNTNDNILYIFFFLSIKLSITTMPPRCTTPRM